MDNFDNRLRSKTALSNRDPAPITGVDFNVNYQARGNLGQFSKLGVESFVKITPETIGTYDFSGSNNINFTSSIGFEPPFTFKQVYGNIYSAIYQGTTLNQANQIWPFMGSNVTAGRYIVQSGYDFQSFDGISNTWSANIYDSTGTSTQVISWARGWEYLDYTVGVSV